jgi:DNA-binding SARP family transcriptional activator
LTIVLRARLLGGLEVELNGTAIDSPVTQRPWTLFAYLALASKPVSRSELANQFWPDVLDQSARASLRSALWALRRQLGEWLVVDGEHVGLRDGGTVWIDAREFERLADSAPQEALELCRGKLLEGIEAEWALAARDRHRERVIELLERLALEREREGDGRTAIKLTRRQAEQDPFDEGAHRRLIVRLAEVGDRAGALRTYRALAERLQRDLGVAPSGATRELVARLRAESAAGREPAARPEPSRPFASSGQLPLVGRARELEELQTTWEAAALGQGAVSVVRGEAGIGKTRLTSELRLLASRSGGRTAACAALDLGGTAPLSLWAELIRELLPSLPAPPEEAGWPQELAALTPELPAHFARTEVRNAAIAPDLQRARLFEAVVALLAWAAREAPLLLVLEDANDADTRSLELAGYAARRMSGLRLMMLLTRRELPLSPDADRLEHVLRSRGLLANELDLEPLPPERVAALARAAASLSNAQVARVVQRADGNALLAVETARALAHRQDELAPSLRGSVRATLAPLSGEVRKLVETAAIASRPLEPAEVDQLSLHGAADQALETGLLLSADGRIAFRHALLRDAVYEETADPRRRALHQHWARTLLGAERAGAPRRPDEVARHLRLAGLDREAVPHLGRAAADARKVAALDEAVAYLAEALAISPDRPELWLELGELEAWRTRRENAEEAFQRALSLLEGGDSITLARAWLQRARAYHGPICIPRAVLDSASRALELLENANAPAAAEARSEALAACAWAEAVAGSVERAERLLSDLSTITHESDDLRTYDVGHARQLALMRRGKFVESYGPSIAAGEAIARAGRPDQAYGCWANAAGAAAAAGDYERALGFLDRGMEAIDGHGLLSIETQLLGARSFVLRRLARFDEARAAAESELAVADQLARGELVAMAHHDRGRIALDQGEYELAAELLDRSLVDGAPISRPLTRLALAEALARAGEPERAAAQARKTVLEPVGPSDFPDALVPRLARVQGLIAAASGESEEAHRRLRESIAGWERLLERQVRAESITTVLADLGRPVVGLVEPERELARARADLEQIQEGRSDAVVS